MISALAGWVDAATVGTTAAAHLAMDGRQIASFDPDALFDYRSQRPILDIVDGTMKETAWPEVVVRYSIVGGRDVLVLTGQEPDLAWKAFSSSVADLAGRLGVVQLITLGAVPAAVPHTMPPPVLTTASNIDLVKGEVRLPQGLLRVPAAAVSIVDQVVAEAGIPTVGFFVQVPHYVSGPYTAGVLALVRRIAEHLEIDISLDSLESEAAAQRDQLDDVVASQPEAQDYVTRLETLATDQPIVSGEELATEIERYLRDARRGERRPEDPPEGAGN
jgi:predicted ATP-grasp superfamily ATP-dependent carboligase